MFPSTSLTALVTLVFTLNVYASPMLRNQITSLGLSKKLNAAASRNIAQGDRARVRRLLNQTGSSTGVGATLTQAVVYTTNIDIGVPPTSYAVIVDTGSANTWVGANKTYVQTNSSAWTGDLVQVIYGSGSFIGNEYTDTVSLGQGLDITDQMIGAAVDSVGFDGGIDGILGLGPARLTNGTLLPNTTTEVPTITDNLFAQGSISDDLVAVFFQPSSSAGAASGELTFGGVNSSRFTGDITYTPVTKVSPASNYWGIDQGISYGSQSLLSDASGFVDTGTTLTLIASDAFAIYQEATGGKLDNTTGMLAITPEQFAGLQSIFFDISGAKFEMTPNAQIWPRSLNEMIGGSADQIYLVIADLGQPSGQGLDFINGMTFLERFYSVYDTTNSQVGFAPTEFTNATTN